MVNMKMFLRQLIYVVLFTVSLASCTSISPDILLAPTITLRPLMPFRSPTATDLKPTLTPMARMPVTPAPSPTPFIHVVVTGETMLGIALRYGITLQALQAANPEVDPQFLSVDAQLIIPLGDEIQAEIPNPTAVNMDWSGPTCYPTGEGGHFCFLLVENNLFVSVENMSAWIGLYEENGTLATSALAVGPLNILWPGEAMPLIAYFHPPLPSAINPHGELLTAVEVPEGDSRYLDWQIVDLKVEVKGELLSEAWVTGMFEPPSETISPSQIWILVVAYDRLGQVVGVRKIETSGDQVFNMIVYSLGGAIERVEILTEVRR